MSVIVHCVISASLICNIYLEMLVINIYLKQRFATFEMLKYYIFLVSRNVNGRQFFLEIGLCKMKRFMKCYAPTIYNVRKLLFSPTFSVFLCCAHTVKTLH